MKLALSVAMVSVIEASGCTSLNQSASSKYVGPFVTSCLNKETEVGGPIAGSSKTTRILWFMKFGDTEFADGAGYGVGGSSLGFSDAEDTKAAAAYKALRKSGADIVIAPKYVVQEYSFLGLYKTTTATITGRAGKTGKITPTDCRGGTNYSSLQGR